MISRSIGLSNSSRPERQTTVYLGIITIHCSSAVNKLFTNADDERHFQECSSTENVGNGVGIKAEDSSVDKLEDYLKSRRTNFVEVNVPAAVV